MRGPLRRVIAERVERRPTPDGLYHYEVEVEDLECGHTIRRRQDGIGYTNAARRRCRQCASLPTPPEEGR